MPRTVWVPRRYAADGRGRSGAATASVERTVRWRGRGELAAVAVPRARPASAPTAAPPSAAATAAPSVVAVVAVIGVMAVIDVPPAVAVPAPSPAAAPSSVAASVVVSTAVAPVLWGPSVLPWNPVRHPAVPAVLLRPAPAAVAAPTPPAADGALFVADVIRIHGPPRPNQRSHHLRRSGPNHTIRL